MKKTLFAFLFTCCSLIFSSISSFAGEWKLDETGYWYQNDDSTYPVSGWQWIDGNWDGVYECYCFDENGYLLTNTTTPDFCIVNENGAWVVDGIVQTQLDDSYDDFYECYCFDENGYLLTNTTTPDFCIVNENGAWVVDGIVQTQLDDSYDDSFYDDYDLTDTVEESDSFFDHDNIDSVTYEDSTLSGISSTPYDGYTIVVNTSTQKYHVIGCRAIKKMNDINKGYAKHFNSKVPCDRM